MSFDRNKFKPAKLASNQEMSKKTDELTKLGNSSDGRPGFHDIEEGVNIFRICPPHDSDSSSFESKITTWLPQEVDEKKDGKETGKKIIANRPIFNSRVHGSTQKDIIEEYISFVYKMISESSQDKDDRQSKMAPINGWRSKDGKWNPGIRYSTAYVFYAHKNNKLARLELWKSDKDRMEELNISEDPNEVIMTDCFSDPNEGVSLIITRQKDKTGKWENILNKREFNPKKFKSWEEFMSSERISDEQLMELEKAPSLKSLYQNSYKRSDFEKALNGLKIFDEKNNFGVFDHDDFLDICTEVDSYYPEDDLKELETDNKPLKQTSEEKSDIFDNMTRVELKSYINDKELDIQIKPNMNDDVIRQLIRDYKPSEEVEQGDLPWEKEDSNKNESTKNKIAEMKARMMAKK